MPRNPLATPLSQPRLQRLLNTIFTRRSSASLHLEAAERASLRKQKFSLHKPGALLHDIEVFLDDLAAADMPLGAKTLHPTGKHLLRLNDLMARPLPTSLKQPQLRSMPRLQGLYLLLRCAGLITVDQRGRKAFLVLDSERVASWSELSANDRYVALLETWLLHSHEDMLKLRSHRRDSVLWRWAELRRGILNDPRLPSSEPQWLDARYALVGTRSCAH